MSKIILMLSSLMFLALQGCSDAAKSGVRTEAPVPTPPPVPDVRPKVEAPKTADAPKVAAAVEKIAIDNFTFTPQKLTVARGTTVTWVNRDDVPNTVRSTEKKFASGTL